MKFVVATLLAASAFTVYGGPPAKTSMYGVALGSTVEQVLKILVARYPDCEAETLGFHDEVRTEGVAQISVSIEPGDGYRNCGATQASSARTASLTIVFVSKEVDAVGGAFEIWFDQYFPPRQSPMPTIGELLAHLSAEYGEPTQTRSEQSQAVDGTDRPIANLFYYRQDVVWFNKPSSEGSPCKGRTCSEFELSASFSAHAPPGKNASDLTAGNLRVVLRDMGLYEREKDWYGKKVDAKK